MPYTPDIAMKLYEKIEANNKLMEELKEKISKQIRETNLTGAPFSDAESTLIDIEKLSAKIEADYRRFELEIMEAPEVS